MTSIRVSSTAISQFFNTTGILIGLSFLFIVMEYQIPSVFFKLTGESFNQGHLSSAVFFVIYTYACFFVLPILFNQLIFKEKLSELGLQRPTSKIKTLFLMSISLLILLPILFLFAKLPQFRQYYFVGKLSSHYFIFFQCIILPFYYFAEEFFFRGFLFLGLWKKVGWHSFWIADVIFVIAHLGKPPLEILYAIPGSLVLSFLALKTRSLYPGMFVHFMVGFTLNYLIKYGV